MMELYKKPILIVVLGSLPTIFCLAYLLNNSTPLIVGAFCILAVLLVISVNGLRSEKIDIISQDVENKDLASADVLIKLKEIHEWIEKQENLSQVLGHRIMHIEKEIAYVQKVLTSERWGNRSEGIG